MSVHLWPYKMASLSGKQMATQLKVKRIKRRNSEYSAAPDKVVINWGCGDMDPHVRGSHIINHPAAVSRAINKLECFRRLDEKEVLVPPYTTSAKVAATRIQTWGATILARHRLEGKDGEGITVCRDWWQVPPAKLYTTYIEADDEYRIMTTRNKVVSAQRKVPIPGMNHDPMFKTTNGGYGFEVAPWCPAEAKVKAIEAVRALGLDFGAVDVIVSKDVYETDVYVLEVNTAPFLTPYGLEKLSIGIEELVHEHNKVW